jgi:transcriptional regulator with XRE-family HTH domain
MQVSALTFPAFGSRLRRARRSHGLKQAALASLLGVDQSTVSRWESGAQTPDVSVQWAAFDLLGPQLQADDALRRLVEHSSACVHLIDESRHICLAYSSARARDWRCGQREMQGVSLWKFATDEIRREEELLDVTGWWDQHTPTPRYFTTTHRNFDTIQISAGEVLWERLYLIDGTPVRLVSGTSRTQSHSYWSAD